MDRDLCPKCYHPMQLHYVGEQGKYRCQSTEYHNEKCYVILEHNNKK